MIIQKYNLEEKRGVPTYSTCPGCGKVSLQRYIYKSTSNHVGNDVGLCSRQKKCGYWYDPTDFFRETNSLPMPKGKNEGPSFIPESIVQKSLSCFDQNNFSIFLNKNFGESIANEALLKYNVGTSKRWSGSTVFWQIDIDQKVRTGRIVLLDSEASPVNIPISLTTWVHYYLRIENFNAVQCLFGEHLLKDNLKKPVVIVDTESLAVIGSILYNEYTWLSTSENSLPTKEMCRTLLGFNINWFPVNGFEKLNKFIF